MFQAVKDSKLHIPDIPTLCQELLNNWNRFIEYFSKHSMQHEVQGVIRHVSMSYRLSDHNTMNADDPISLQPQGFELSIICDEHMPIGVLTSYQGL